MKFFKYLISFVIFVVIVNVVLRGFYIVQENEYVCVFRFAKMEHVVDKAGLYFKVPFLDESRVFNKAIQIYDLEPSEVITSDKKSMIVDSYIIWKIVDPLLFFQRLGGNLEAEGRLNVVIYNELKTLMGTLEQETIINNTKQESKNRKSFNTQLHDRVVEKGKEYGIQIVDVKVKRLDLPTANENAVYKRMISERNQMAELFRAKGEEDARIIRNAVDREVSILVSDAKAQAEKIRAEGEEEYMKIIAAAFSTDDRRSFYDFIISLDALEASLKGKDKTLIINKETKLGKTLLGELK